MPYASKEIRDVIIKYDATPVAFPLDAYKAVANKVQEMEDAHSRSALSNLTAKPIAIYGNTPFKVYVFDVTTDMANATYTFEYVETVPSFDDIS